MKTVAYIIAGTFAGIGLADVVVPPARATPALIAVQPPACTCPEPFEAFGIRLAPLVQTFDDGTVAIERGRFYDVERDEPCSVVRIGGDVPRCLPPFVRDTKPGWYADPACSQLVLVVDACAELPRYVRDDSAPLWQTCEPAPLVSLRPLGAPIAGDVLYRFDQFGACAANVGGLGATNVALPIGAAIPLDAFVSVVSFEPGGP